MIPIKNNPLDQSFYIQSDVIHIARSLLGKILVTNINGKRTSGRIVETEAYRGFDDKACHAYGNKKTERTKTMFLEGGRSYVYLCYGIHHLFNVVTGPKDQADAVLIRAIEPIEGIDIMLQRRNFSKIKTNLTAGPGTLTKALGIDRKLHNSISLNPNQDIWIEDDGTILNQKIILESRRVGVDYAEECALWNWRFRVKNSKWTSKGKGKGE